MRKGLLLGGLVYSIIPLTAAVSLANFQKLNVEVTEACKHAYDQTIPGCQVIDFSPEGTCSPGCVSGLNQVASGVLGSCGGVVAGSSSLLGKIFNGLIIQSLCPNNGDPSSPSQQQSTTAAPTTTAQSTSQAATKSSDKASTTVSASASPSSTASAGPSSSSPAANPQSSTASSGSTSVPAGGSVLSSTSSSAATQTSASQSQPQSNNGKSGLTVQQQQIAAVKNSGGGSPFDIIGFSAAGRPLPRDVTAVSLGLALLIIGWLLR